MSVKPPLDAGVLSLFFIWQYALLNLGVSNYFIIRIKLR